MKAIKILGLVIWLGALAFFTSLIFFGEYQLSQESFDEFVESKGIQSELFIGDVNKSVVDKVYSSSWALSADILDAAERSHQAHRQNIVAWEKEGDKQDLIDAEWGKVIWLDLTKKHGEFSYPLVIGSGKGFVVENKVLLLLLTFGLGVLGVLMYILPNVVLLGPAGIKNDGIMQESATNRGVVGIAAFVYLVCFYLLLYFMPDIMVNWIYIVDPVSKLISGNPASQWFLYGFLYCVVMTVMAIRMYVKYRHNMYQIVRTTSVLFFQIGFAFLIPEIMVRFNQPWYDFKNAWPLDYDFFFAWNLDDLIQRGGLGLFILFWGTALTLIIVPVMVYFFGKRWYCSWVCGCGGLAETLGDPYRQLSDKSLVAWKAERWIIYSVLVFATVMTAATLYSFTTENDTVMGIATYDLQFWYGLLVGSIFSGVIGTGFYPIMGNRVWCRFGCPLAAYMGLIQRFKSRFRITTNGGQCISCGNCSTYCEQGIDVRLYAQRGENIVRSSCVGCGVCSAVCPRGVLKLENGPEKGRIQDDPIFIGHNHAEIKE